MQLSYLHGGFHHSQSPGFHVLSETDLSSMAVPQPMMSAWRTTSSLGSADAVERFRSSDFCIVASDLSMSLEQEVEAVVGKYTLPVAVLSYGFLLT